jgi:hypothetical protein
MNRKIVEDRVALPALVRCADPISDSRWRFRDGFKPAANSNRRLKATISFASITEDEWNMDVLSFITTGGEAFTAYNEYRKVSVEKRTLLKWRTVALRLSIGLIYRHDCGRQSYCL